MRPSDEKTGMSATGSRAETALIPAASGSGAETDWIQMPLPSTTPTRPIKHPEYGAPKVIYTYRDFVWRETGYVYEFSDPDEDGSSRRVPLTLWKADGESPRWEWGGPRGLYHFLNTPDLVWKKNKQIVLVQRERAAAAASRLFPDAVVTTTMPTEKKLWDLACLDLSGRRILVWPDAGNLGRDWEMKILKQLKEVNPSQLDVFVLPRSLPVVGDEGPALLGDFTPPDGWNAENAVEGGWTPEHIGLHLAQEGSRSIDVPKEVAGYVIDAGGVWTWKIGKNEQPYKAKISSRVDVLAQSYTPEREWGFLLQIRDPNGESVKYCLPRSILTQKSAVFAAMLERGADIRSLASEDFYRYLMDSQPSERVCVVKRPGWYTDAAGDRAFVLPGGSFRSGKGDEFMLDASAEDRLRFSQKGTLADWKKHVAALCESNTRLTFAVACAFVGPLLHLLGAEGGGFHLYGGSSIGKSTALKAATSVWGGRDFFRQWRATGNALEHIAAFHSDTFLVLDEINQVDESELGDVVYALGNGSGKARMAKDITSRPVSRFRIMYLSSGEESVRLRMQQGQNDELGGQEVRLPSIAADAGVGLGVFQVLHGFRSGAELADAFDARSRRYFGTAGAAWAEFLAACQASWVRARVGYFVADFMKYLPAGAAPQVDRVARRFALVAAAGELAIEAGILPWGPGEAMDGAEMCLEAWLDQRGGTQSQESNRHVRQVRQFLAQHGESRFTAWGQFNDEGYVDTEARTSNRVGFRRVNDSGREDYYVFPDPYRTEICRGLDPRDVTRTLKENDLLVLGTGGKPQRQERVPGHPNGTRVYRIKAEIFDLEL